MQRKTINRILYGLIAVVLLALAGRELLTAGFNLGAAGTGGIGLLLGYMALTGAG
jgi:hypothetical protein